MTTEEMRNGLQDIFTLALNRVQVGSIGEQQYRMFQGGEELQLFETLSMEELFTEIEQELLDLINYAGMGFLKVQAMRSLIGIKAVIMDPESGTIQFVNKRDLTRDVDITTGEEFREWVAGQ